ncbi:MAG: cytochrome c maturation protein CcmE [Candidatus Zixiibacteriota bacterium]
MKAKLIIGLIIIVGFGGWVLYSLMGTTIRYVSLSDVTTADGAVQVMGKIDKDSVDYDVEHSHLTFYITDLEEPDSNRRLKIVYSGVVPGNFDQATSIVAKGLYHEGALQADQLLVKCPSKYQGFQGTDQEA